MKRKDNGAVVGMGERRLLPLLNLDHFSYNIHMVIYSIPTMQLQRICQYPALWKGLPEMTMHSLCVAVIFVVLFGITLS